MIESLQLSDPLPVRGVVARLAGRRKAALMGIGMARRALRKGKASVFHIRFCIRDGNVALRARRLLVRPGKRISCLGMAEQ